MDPEPIQMKEASVRSAHLRTPQEINEALMSADEQRMTFFGKRQQFRRNFGLISIIGLGCTLMLTWEGVIITYQYAVFNGGPTGSIIQYLFVVLGVLLQVIVMAEIASMIPLSGGQYNWVSILSPPWCSKFLSYMTGWLTTIGWLAGCASASWVSAGVVEAVVVLNYPTFEPKLWQSLLICYSVIFMCLVMNTTFGRIFPKFEALALFLHIAGFFGLMIAMLYLAPKKDAAFVWKTFENGGGFSTYGQSFLQGATTFMLAFVGSDSGAHIAEEIENAPVVLPRSMISSVVINGILGFAMLLVMLYCSPTLTKISGFPFVAFFEKDTGSVAGATGMIVIILLIILSATVGIIATASRMVWAFAREDGLPGSRWLSRIEPRTSLPIYAICATTVFTLLLPLLNLGSEATFSALVGLTVSCFYTVFLIAAFVMLHKRLTTPPEELFWGEFRLGRMGVPLTIAAIIYSLIGWFFSFWPPVSELSVETFNWSSVVYAGVTLLSMAWWLIHARRVYTGPKIEV